MDLFARISIASLLVAVVRAQIQSFGRPWYDPSLTPPFQELRFTGQQPVTAPPIPSRHVMMRSWWAPPSGFPQQWAPRQVFSPQMAVSGFNQQQIRLPHVVRKNPVRQTFVPNPRFHMHQFQQAANPAIHSAFTKSPVFKQIKHMKKKKKRISVLSGPLIDVVPYPSQRRPSHHMSKKARFKAVAQAKPFHSILSRTSMGLKKVLV